MLSTPSTLPRRTPEWLWPVLFFALPIGYGLYYAPYGINETDGGFLSGLAWQVLNGKTLYADVVYVRPPLPVWLRATELLFLPENFQILGERWIFYVKIALYSWLGAAVLAEKGEKWMIAAFGFVVSAHSYPPMAWHTVDGILFAVLAAYFLQKNRVWSGVIAGFWLCFALLCKQSFYPLPPFFLVYLFWLKRIKTGPAIAFISAFMLSNGLFFSYLWKNNLLDGYIKMTAGAAEGGQAFEHGVLDYLRITPELALPSLLLLGLIFLPLFPKSLNPKRKYILWLLWLLTLALSFAAVTLHRQEHTVPFAQSRILFCLAAVSAGVAVFAKKTFPLPAPKSAAFFLLLSISWSAAISWGYALPILFATPWIWTVMTLGNRLRAGFDTPRLSAFLPPLYLLLLLACFRTGYEFVYRDGRRSEMRNDLGQIFPCLSGIYSDDETARLYGELKTLANRYGPNFKTLPAFPQSNFITKTYPPLPLDWVVERETNGDNELITKALEKHRPVIFIQKSFNDKIQTDPQLKVSRQIMSSYKKIEETEHFFVFQ